MTGVSFESKNIRNIRITINLVEKKSNKLKVSYTAGGQAERLEVAAAHVAGATVEGQVPAVSGTVLRIAPVIAV